MNTEFKVLKDCLACGSRNLHKYLDLGLQPLANDLKDEIKDERSLYPLQLNVCKECWHSQLSIAVNPELLYKNYLYVSGTSKTLNNFFDNLAEKKTDEIRGRDVLDIACNDGTFLEKFQKRGWSVYGVDPAENLRYLCESKGINIQTSFFAGKNYKRPNKKFDLITCFNVLAHISNPVDFLKEAGAILKDDGLILIQTSQRDMIIEGQFDTVYHEHHSFFSLSSFVSLSWRAGLFVHKVEYTDIHGGSYLITLTKNPFLIWNLISEETSKEEREGRYSIGLYDNYTNKVNNLKNHVKSTVLKLVQDGYKMIGFGAAAKGIVLLNCFELNLDFVIDENDLKIGKYIAGVDTLISDYPKEIEGKVCFVILAWNFYDEIVNKIKSKYPNLECKFLRVFPEVSLE